MDVTPTPAPATLNGDYYEVCVSWEESAECGKTDTISHMCSNEGSDGLISDWSSGSAQKQCKTVRCGEEAEFGIKDIDSCADVDYAGTINGISASCSSYSYCDGSDSDCYWKFKAPDCPQGTPQPTKSPTAEPTMPTQTPTDGKEPCDCYATHVTDVNNRDSDTPCYHYTVEQIIPGMVISFVPTATRYYMLSACLFLYTFRH